MHVALGVHGNGVVPAVVSPTVRVPDFPFEVFIETVGSVPKLRDEDIGVLVVVPRDVRGVVRTVSQVERGIEIALGDDGRAEELRVPLVGRPPLTVSYNPVDLLLNVGNARDTLTVQGEGRLGSCSDFQVFPGVLAQYVGVRSRGDGERGGKLATPKQRHGVSDDRFAASTVGHRQCHLIVGDAGEVRSHLVPCRRGRPSPGEGPFVGEFIAIGVRSHSQKLVGGLVVVPRGNHVGVPYEVGLRVLVGCGDVGWGNRCVGREWGLVAATGHGQPNPDHYQDN